MDGNRNAEVEWSEFRVGWIEGTRKMVNPKIIRFQIRQITLRDCVLELQFLDSNPISTICWLPDLG